MQVTFSSAAGTRGRKAILSGFVYTKQRTETDNWTQWECVKRKSGCKGRLRIKPNEDSSATINQHNHVADFGEAKAARMLGNMANRATQEVHLHPSHLTRDILSSANRESLVTLPTELALKQRIRRLRRREQPPLPTTFEEVTDIPTRYTDIDDEKFLMVDNGVGEANRVMIFGTRDGLREISTSEY